MVKDEIPKFIDLKLESSQGEIFSSSEPLSYSLKLIDNTNQTNQSDIKKLPVEYISAKQKEEEQKTEIHLEKYSLILFDFDKSEITANNKKIVDFIKSKIKPNSIVKINGFADRVGEQDYNKKLSEQRALSTAAALRIKPQEINGIGSSVLLYDNNLPEGRYYCRTVEINIENRTEK